MHFLEWTFLYFDENCSEIYFPGSNQQYTNIGSNNGLAQVRHYLNQRWLSLMAHVCLALRLKDNMEHNICFVGTRFTCPYCDKSLYYHAFCNFSIHHYGFCTYDTNWGHIDINKTKWGMPCDYTLQCAGTPEAGETWGHWDQVPCSSWVSFDKIAICIFHQIINMKCTLMCFDKGYL